MQWVVCSPPMVGSITLKIKPKTFDISLLVHSQFVWSDIAGILPIRCYTTHKYIYTHKAGFAFSWERTLPEKLSSNTVFVEPRIVQSLVEKELYQRG